MCKQGGDKLRELLLKAIEKEEGLSARAHHGRLKPHNSVKLLMGYVHMGSFT